MTKIPQINIYVIARIAKDHHAWTDQVCRQLDKKTFSVFKPKDFNPWRKKHEKFPKQVFDVDLLAIKNSHLALMLPEYGNDCAWEAGWYANSKKPVIVFVDQQIQWLKDWMVKGGLDYITTHNPETYKILKRDPILKYKEIFLIKAIKELNQIISKIFQQHYYEKNKKS
jgi:hypothetical protein